MAPKTTHVAVAAVVTFVAFATWLFGGWSQGDTVQVVDDVALGVLVIPAVVFATRAARSAHGRTRAAWVALIVGLCGWFAGEAIWAYYELILNQAPFPSLADAGFLALPVGACVALLLFPDDYNRYSVGRAFLDELYRPVTALRQPKGDTIACRCEEVTAGQIRETARMGCEGPNQMKAFLRCGMGPCQGRLCGLTVTELIAEERGTTPDEVGYYRLRPPVKPITLGELASLPISEAERKAVER